MTTTFGIKTTLKDGVSPNGAWNKAQLAVLGVPWPPLKGWKDKLVRKGVRLTAEEHASFVALRTVAPADDA